MSTALFRRMAYAGRFTTPFLQHIGGRVPWRVRQNINLVRKEQKALLVTINQSILEKLRKEAVIPDVIDEFSPSVFLQAEHPSGAKVQLGNTLKVKDTQNIPNIIVTPEDARFDGEDTKYTLCLTGTDATSRENPIWGEFCHWLVTDISPKSGTLDFRDANELMRYMGPSPLKKTGKHRYVLLLFRNGSEQPHYLLDRRKWSFDVKEPRIGARYYARKYGLTLVGANFFFCRS